MNDESLCPEITTVNGVEFTPDMFFVLKNWQEATEKEDGLPAVYVNHLGDIQDYLTLIMADLLNDENGEKKKITELLCRLIHIKEDLKCFIHAQKPID